ncbi:MAG: enoyl-CoA hydratase/isomerase family protein [Actinomycetota bacterium]|nr:enoyl-CoA hydratase/isomerase family protein [Actinomycetota bacterium]
MQLDEITYEAAGGVATVTLDRPQLLNAISARAGGTRDQIIAAVELAEADDNVGCVVLRGAGRAFCGGGDLTGNAKRERSLDDLRFVEAAAAFHRRLTASQVPVIAAVHGHCLGAGLLLAASCDFVIAAESAKFGFPEGRLGLVGASALVPRIGRQWAKFLMLTGESISAAQAQSMGIVLAVEPDDELQARVLDLAGRIARMPREGARLNRQAIDAVADAAGDAAGQLASVAHDAITLNMGVHAKAPDGRTFRSIIDSEGMDGMKAARAAQYDTPWLR